MVVLRPQAAGVILYDPAFFRFVFHQSVPERSSNAIQRFIPWTSPSGCARYPGLKRLRLHHIERHWLTISFFFGFIVDSLTLNRVDHVFDNIVLTMLSTVVLDAATAGKIPEKILEK